LDRLHRELRLDGLVWDHHAQGTGVDDQRMVTMVNELGRRGLPALVHVHALDLREGVAHAESLARQAPDTTIVALGAFSAVQRQWDLERIASACRNLWFDTTVTVPIGPIELYVNVVGAERVVFGTDMYANPRWGHARPPVLEAIVGSDTLTDKEKELLLWGNAERLFPRLRALE
jgi:predicted TIM-barrel fold metal-dependent hydrolase